jgi:hypothetical protein
MRAICTFAVYSSGGIEAWSLAHRAVLSTDPQGNVTKTSIEERRSSIRISPKGSVVISAGAHQEHARISNISRHGMLALTTAPATGELADQEIDLEVRLDDASGEWMSLSGRVLRVDDCAVAISFTTVPESFAHVMFNSASASHGHRRVLSLVLIDATSSRRLKMAEAFRAAGCAVIDVATPLEVIVRLGEARFEPDVIAIADSLPTATADDLRRFVEQAHPRAKLVTIGDAADDPGGLAHWLSATPDDLVARVLKLLGAQR